ncbi:hypothetical protein PC119_g15701 [Phytophthora cactorum]|nr:hypothetical protein PC119_g15701 [Phytophthora cactorum]
MATFGTLFLSVRAAVTPPAQPGLLRSESLAPLALSVGYPSATRDTIVLQHTETLKHKEKNGAGAAISSSSHVGLFCRPYLTWCAASPCVSVRSVWCIKHIATPEGHMFVAIDTTCYSSPASKLLPR